MQLSDKIKEVVRIEDLANRLGYPVQSNGFCYSIYKQEKTPSLKLYPKSDTFNDFSSGNHGTVIDFYMGVYSVDFSTAVKELGDIYGLTYGQSDWKNRPKPEKSVRQSSENIFECMSDDERILYEERAAISDEKQALVEVQKYRIERNAEIFEEMYLYCTERGWNDEAMRYLLNERMLDAKTIVFFKLFFIKNYYEVNNHLKKKFKIEDLQRSGLFNVKEDGSGNLIFWNHRLILPYMHNKKIVYLRGRYFDSENHTQTSTNKYLGLRNDALGVNTPKRFFNLDALSGLIPGEKIYITEGEFDAMLLADLGRRAIAIPGVGNLPKAEKFKLLSKAEVVVCPDNDEAGKKMLDGIQKIFRDLGKEIYVKRFAGKDVTDFVKSISIDELIEEVSK